MLATSATQGNPNAAIVLFKFTDFQCPYCAVAAAQMKDFVRRHGSDYGFALVGEPTSMEVVHVTKGSLWATLRATGRAVHSSMPERGENAVLKLARALIVIDRVLGGRLAGFTHPVLGPSTCNIGVVRGGSRPNIVPDLAEAELDIRITPSLAAAGGALALLREVILEEGLPVEIVDPHENPPMETSLADPHLGGLLGQGLPPAGAPWFSAAAHLSQGGIPSVCLGPGSIDQAHTADEWIDLRALEEGAGFFTRWIAGLGG